MNTIKIRAPEIIGNGVKFSYEVSGAWQESFSARRECIMEYSMDLRALPGSVAIVPFLANLLPMAWVYDAEIIVPACDADFYDSIEAFKQGYRKMYPTMTFGGKLTVAALEKNAPADQHGAAAFFSGGVDAFHTLTCHAKEKPTLITLWGADIKLGDTLGWQRVEALLKDTAAAFETDYVTIRSGFRGFLNEGVLSEKVAHSGDGWWHGFQHGLGIIAHAAPVAYLLGKKTVYIASSHTAGDIANLTCASDPTIDNYIRFCGCQVSHDGYDFTRQAKLHHITRFSKETGKKIPLRVCWESAGGSNCCHCEKCFRTILGIYAEGFDPREFGFEYGDFGALCREIAKNRDMMQWHRESRYVPMHRALRENYSLQTVSPHLRWLYRTDASRLGELSFFQKARKKGRSLAKRCVHLLGRAVKKCCLAPARMMSHPTKKQLYTANVERFFQSVRSRDAQYQAFRKVLATLPYGSLRKRKLFFLFAILYHLTGMEAENYMIAGADVYSSLFKQMKYTASRWRQNIFQFSVNRTPEKRAFRALLDNKEAFNTFFHDFIGREWITSKRDEKEIRDFLQKHRQVMAKPLTGSGGKGAFVLSYTTYQQQGNSVFGGGDYILEQVLSQKGFLHTVNPSSVNTLRVNTLYQNGHPVLLSAFLRTGKAGQITDNVHSGGINWQINPLTGEIQYGAAMEGDFCTAHPDSGVQMRGKRIPRFHEAIQLCFAAHDRVPEMPQIGWDVVISDDCLALLEGNSGPGINNYDGTIPAWPMMKKYLIDNQVPINAHNWHRR